MLCLANSDVDSSGNVNICPIIIWAKQSRLSVTRQFLQLCCFACSEEMAKQRPRARTYPFLWLVFLWCFQCFIHLASLHRKLWAIICPRSFARGHFINSSGGTQCRKIRLAQICIQYNKCTFFKIVLYTKCIYMFVCLLI